MKRLMLTIVLVMISRVGIAGCVECHAAYSARDVRKSEGRESKCQGDLQRAIDEVTYVEKRLVALRRISASLAGREVGDDRVEKKMQGARESYEAFLDTQVASLEDLVKNKGRTCEKLRQAYAAINEARGELGRRRALGVIVLGTLAAFLFGLNAYLRLLPEPRNGAPDPAEGAAPDGR